MRRGNSLLTTLVWIALIVVLAFGLAGLTVSHLSAVNYQDNRQHAKRMARSVVSTAVARIMQDTGCPIGPISGGCFTAIISPQGELIGEPLRSGEGAVIADLDFSLIDSRKRLMDSRGHYSRPELLTLLIDRTHVAHAYAHRLQPSEDAVEEADDHSSVLAWQLSRVPGRSSQSRRTR